MLAGLNKDGECAEEKEGATAGGGPGLGFRV